MWLACVCAALASAYLIIAPHFPYLGISFVLVSFGIVGLKTQPHLSKQSKIYGLLSVFFAGMLVIRSSPEIIFLDIVASVFFGSLMLANAQSITSPPDALISPFTTLIELFQAKTAGFSHDFYKVLKLSDKKQLMPTLSSLGVTAILLIIIIPILAAANPIFNNFITSFINLDWLVGNDALVRNVVRLGIFGVVLWFLIKIASLVPKKNISSENNLLDTVPLFIPQLAVFTVLTIFIATQLNLYTLTTQQLAAYGLTHSGRTREVFAHLSIVSLILFGLHFYSLKKQGKYTKLLYFGLLFQGIILNVFALFSDLAYINSWGLTHKRLWGLLIVLFIFSIFTMAALAWVKSWSRHKLLHATLTTVGLTFVLANLLHFDFLIYHLRNAQLPEGTDYGYIARLSPDSYSYANQLTVDMPACLSECDSSRLRPYYQLLNQISHLREKYRYFDVRNFNVSELITLQQLYTAGITAEYLNDLRTRLDTYFTTDP